MQDAWTAFHNNKDFVSKHLAPLYVGDVVDYKSVSIECLKCLFHSFPFKGGWGMSDVTPCLGSQGCHLVAISCPLSCFSA